MVGRDGRNAYNWLAYATRRNGNPAASLPLYEKALTIDPRHRGAHEYRDLKKAVEQYEKTGKVSATH